MHHHPSAVLGWICVPRRRIRCSALPCVLICPLHPIILVLLYEVVRFWLFLFGHFLVGTIMVPPALVLRPYHWADISSIDLLLWLVSWRLARWPVAHACCAIHGCLPPAMVLCLVHGCSHLFHGTHAHAIGGHLSW